MDAQDTAERWIECVSRLGPLEEQIVVDRCQWPRPRPWEALASQVTRGPTQPASCATFPS